MAGWNGGKIQNTPQWPLPNELQQIGYCRDTNGKPTVLSV